MCMHTIHKHIMEYLGNISKGNMIDFHLLQFLSSDMSLQSLSPSQMKEAHTQWPLSHWNSADRQSREPECLCVCMCLCVILTE